MLDDYYNNFYIKLFERSDLIRENNYYLARKLAAWKRKMLAVWEHLEVLNVKAPDPSVGPLNQGELFNAEIRINLQELSADDIGIEVLFGRKVNGEVKNISWICDMKLAEASNSHATFRCSIPMKKAGVYDYVFRVYPNNPHLPNRQDLNLVKWI
jgi:hypothetical protein